jgi:hypothetical protein
MIHSFIHTILDGYLARIDHWMRQALLDTFFWKRHAPQGEIQMQYLFEKSLQFASFFKVYIHIHYSWRYCCMFEKEYILKKCDVRDLCLVLQSFLKQHSSAGMDVHINI